MVSPPTVVGAGVELGGLETDELVRDLLSSVCGVVRGVVIIGVAKDVVVISDAVKFVNWADVVKVEVLEGEVGV